MLVVTRLDRLGRDAMDVSATVAQLAGRGVRVHCLALGGVDLTSSAGRMTMGVINAVAQFERDLLVERTQSGLARARDEDAGADDAVGGDAEGVVYAGAGADGVAVADGGRFDAWEWTVSQRGVRASRV